MKSLRLTLAAAAALAVSPLLSSTASAQGPIKVDLKKVDVIVQTSPDYSPTYVVEKRISRNRKWLEFEVEFEVDKKPLNAAESIFVDNLLFKYYVVFGEKNPATGKNYMLTGQVNHINVEPKETTHSVMYVSPSAATRIRNKSGEVAKGDVEGFAVQVLYNGEVVAEKSDFKESTRWWVTAGIPPTDGLLVPKSETPFAPLWYDYHAEVKSLNR